MKKPKVPQIVKESTSYSIRIGDREYTAVIGTQGGMSIYEGIEVCSGVLRHWGTKKELQSRLQEIIDAIEMLSE